MENKNRTDAFVALSTILCTNALLVYGVLYQQWNFFIVLYAYWFGEFISSVFDQIKYSTVMKRGELLRSSGEKKPEGRFLFLFVYWVFIVLIAGFILAPENTFGENLLVVLFMNKSFDITLFCMVAGELIVYYQQFMLSRNYQAEVVVRQNSMLNKRTMVMHISILLGAIAWFSMYAENFFIHIEPGKYGAYSFMLIFVGIKLVGELLGVVQSFQGKSK